MNRNLIFQNILQKTLKLCNYFWHKAWIGVVIWILRWPKHWKEDIAIFSGISFGILPGILVMPLKEYVLGMFATAMIFVIYNICETITLLVNNKNEVQQLNNVCAELA